MNSQHPKLVRDKIPQYLKEHHGIASDIYICSDDEYRTRLFNKLHEEIAELIENPCLEELADVSEVLRALTTLLGYTHQELEQCRIHKERERGGITRS